LEYVLSGHPRLSPKSTLSTVFGNRLSRKGEPTFHVSPTGDIRMLKMPLHVEITVIIILKTIFLLALKEVWFTEPVIPENGAVRVDQHFFIRD
jgi:hypothetical protein